MMPLRAFRTPSAELAGESLISFMAGFPTFVENAQKIHVFPQKYCLFNQKGFNVRKIGVKFNK